MVQDAAEKVVGIFEKNEDYRLEDVLKFVKRKYHISTSVLAEVKHRVETLLTYDLLEPERAVDVC